MIGRTVSHYRILAELGRGGMGLVYKAEDLNLGRPVAIKFLPPSSDRDEEAEQRFIREAKTASALDHPNIGVIHEIDQTPDGQTFIVMGCYEGGTVRHKLGQADHSLVEILDLVAQVAHGLGKAHANGIVHRDIKPANLLLTPDGQVKIIDFGLAMLSDQTRLTRTGTTSGTLAYMAPEQVTGGRVDPRTDIFSLGVVLYELVTLKLPFSGDNEASVLYQIVNQKPPTLAVHREALPAGLEEIVAKALAKDPDDRYQDTSEFLNDLELVRSSLAPGPTSKSVSVFLARKPVRIGPWRITALIGAGILVGVAGFLLLQQQPGGGGPDDRAVAMIDFRDLATPDDLTGTTGLSGLVHVGLVETSPIRVVSPEYLYDLRRRHFGSARGPIGEDQALEVARQAGASLLLSGQMGMLEGNRFAMWRLVETGTGETLGAKRVQSENLVNLADEILAGVLPLIARESGVDVASVTPSVSDLTTASPQAFQYYVAGILARDEAKAQEASENLEQAIKVDSTFALALFELSRIHYSGTPAGIQFGLAQRNAQKAWQLRGKLGVKDRLRLEAWLQQLDYRVAEAIGTYEEILQRWPDDREILKNYHRILFHFWYGDRALAVAEKGLNLYPDDLYFGLFYQIGLAHQGRMQEALEATRGYLDQHPREPNAWDELGLRYLSLGLPDSAEVAFERALQIDPHFLPSQRGLSFCAYSRGDLNRAIAIGQELLARKDILPGQRVSLLTDTAFWPGLTMFFAEAGRFEEALALFEEARRFTDDPVSELRLEAERSRLWLQIGWAPAVLRWSESLTTHQDQRLAPLLAVQYQARALVAVDSLAAAKAAVEELYATEESWGGVARFEALKVTADIALAENRPEVALQKLAEIAKLGISDGGFFDLDYRLTLARAHQRAGRPQEAIRILENLLRVYGSHTVAHYEIGKIYEEIGEADQARQALTTFLNAWSGADAGLPQMEDARRRLASLR